MTRFLVTAGVIFAAWSGSGTFFYLRTGDPIIAFFAAQTFGALMLMAMLPDWTD